MSATDNRLQGHWQYPAIIFKTTICATIGGALFGYDTGIINGASSLIKEDLNLSKEWMNHVVSSTIGAAAVSSLLSGFISDWCGRKSTQMFSAVLFIVAGVVMAIAQNGYTLVAGRTIAGAAIGLVSSIVPVYISEIAPSGIRGSLLVLNQIFIAFGILLSSAIAIAFTDQKDGWRYMLGLSAVPAVFQFVFFFKLPESPRYQILKKKYANASRTLQRLRGEESIDVEVKEIMFSVQEGEKIYGSHRGCISIFSNPHVLKALFVGCSLHFIQQFSGINCVIYYSSPVLKSAGFGTQDALLLSLLPFSTNFLATIVGVWSVESLGRKRTLYISLLGMHIALLVVTVSYIPAYLHPIKTDAKYEMKYNISDHCLQKTECALCMLDDQCAFCAVNEGFYFDTNATCVHKGLGRNTNEFARAGRCSLNNNTSEFLGGSNLIYAYGHCPSFFSWLAVFGIMLYVLAFAPGTGPLVWTLNAEIYPLWCRSKANAIATTVNWTCNYIISHYFITVTELIGAWGTFLLFSIICVCSAIFVVKRIPETKCYHLEESEFLFMTNRERKDAIKRLQGEKESKDLEGTCVTLTNLISEAERDSNTLLRKGTVVSASIN